MKRHRIRYIMSPPLPPLTPFFIFIFLTNERTGFLARINIIDFMRYRPTQEDEAHSRGKSKKAYGLTLPVSQSSAVKPTLPMSIITSYVIVVGAQGL
ncbi:hypothetical protein ElyMa_002335900 [Elysia marginata]|uniref:Uncharacterized protein n=1 Tax=Elysia marginata TaxID=1093978 RepID=A0AAV4G7M8_9GAST|nr:hypothetical protein ElyMa_002335900 [Elysia marginata]